MTVSITPCWKNHLRQALGLFCCLFWLGVAQAAVPGAPGSIEPKSARLEPEGSGQVLTAEFSIALGARFEDAVARGVVLPFRFEFTLTRTRKYWMDEHVTGRLIEFRLGYQALTRQYRLTQGNSHLNFDTLDEALKALGRVNRLPVIDKGHVVPGESYRAAVRLSLDRNQLPKPLQVDALADRDWHIEARTRQWEFVPGDK